MSKTETNNLNANKKKKISRIVLFLFLILVCYFLFSFFMDLGSHFIVAFLTVLFIFLFLSGLILEGKALFSRFKIRTISPKINSKSSDRKKEEYYDFKRQQINLDFDYTKKIIRKCPNCGIVLPSFAKKCPNCGYEF